MKIALFPTQRPQKSWSLLLTALAVMAALLGAGRALADTTNEAAAKRFLENEDRAKTVTNYLHLGADFKGVELKSSGAVTNASGKLVPGHFNLCYRYSWSDDDYTDVTFLFNQNGSFYELQVGKTTAILNQPFLLSNAAVKVLGAALVGVIGDQLKDDDKKKLEKIIEDADAKAMLTFLLAFERNVLKK